MRSDSGGRRPYRLRRAGRAGAGEWIAALAAPAAGPRLVVLTGAAGLGRSTVLADAEARLAERGVPTVRVSITRTDRQYPGSVASRLRAALAERRHAVVFLDDVQWIDDASLAELAQDPPTTVVCACRTPLPEAAEGLRSAFAALRGERTVEVLALRPADRAETAVLLTGLLRARPAGELAETLRRATRGVPALLEAAIAGYREAGSLRVVDRHAYLLPPEQLPRLPAEHAALAGIRTLGDTVWPVAKAIAILAPLLSGGGVPLVAEATGLAEDQVRAALHALWSEGLIHRVSLRFRLPVLAWLLQSSADPSERRRIAQVAIDAVWEGGIVGSDPRFLPEQLVQAGRPADPERAGAELLARGREAMLGDAYYAARWLRAAAELLTDPGRQAEAMFLHAAACNLALQSEPSARAAATALSAADRFTPELLLELEVTRLAGLRGMGDVRTMDRIAGEDWRSVPGGPANQVVTRAAALVLTDRWPEAADFLDETRDIWLEGNAASVAFGLLFGPAARALQGDLAGWERSLARPELRPMLAGERNRVPHVQARARILLLFGELGRADALLAAHGQSARELPPSDLALHAALSGDWDRALDLARLTLATGAALAFPPAHTGICRMMAHLLTARGRFTRAREILANGRLDQPVQTQLLDIAEAAVEYLLGAVGRARRLLVAGLAHAAEQDVVLGTEDLWLWLLEWELIHGSAGEAARCTAELGRLTTQLDNGRARHNHLLARAVTEGDASAAAEAVGVARDRGQPSEIADTLFMLARHGHGDAKQLAEAYDLFGQLDALVPRARLRVIMQARGVSVPDDRVTAAEQERLLASLVSEGLTNREVATVLRVSENGVEGRLNRLFQRTGYRSRVELATAILTGDYPA
ncbi:LuxR C-terminal-related transcriptional regulator [Amycolatopsis cynarae]|uniref:LuxR C-terminal-related transcriptional regulator n=1 Tax=Amycolatopsis cynarae TaxID=2995223 RepID=A0ABY7AZ39_9PSEU|nr:LuxR C-terminal-related transcriptional regulator [Amycolatopsis sp. HUAS 11-8]WAL64303.1 LuxR C-terminal-related transcriptional regulator [Amycolatopsis sp. HUAS 11-8]